MASTLGERLRDARIAKGFATAKEAAAAYGWNQSTYRAHENGTREPPKYMLLTYASHYGVSVSWLLRGIEERTKSRPVEGHAIPIVTWGELPEERREMSGAITQSRNGAIVLPEAIGSSETLALDVRDDAMVSPHGDASSLYEGDKAIVDIHGQVRPGRIVLYFDKTTAGHYFRKVQIASHGTLRLVALNPDHQSFETPTQSPAILGVVIGLHRNF